jgi:hypothetical protein
MSQASSSYTRLNQIATYIQQNHLATVQTKDKNSCSDRYHNSKNTFLCTPCSWVPSGCSCILSFQFRRLCRTSWLITQWEQPRQTTQTCFSTCSLRSFPGTLRKNVALVQKSSKTSVEQSFFAGVSQRPASFHTCMNTWIRTPCFRQRWIIEVSSR